MRGHAPNVKVVKNCGAALIAEIAVDTGKKNDYIVVMMLLLLLLNPLFSN